MCSTIDQQKQDKALHYKDLNRLTDDGNPLLTEREENDREERTEA